MKPFSPCTPHRRRGLRAWAAPCGALLAGGLALATPARAQEALVQRLGHGWQIQAQGQSLTALALALAQVSGSRLRGTAEALASAPPLRATRPWQARDLDEAWQLLLDGRVQHARQCSGQGGQQRCTVWLAAAASASPAASASASPVANSGTAPARLAARAIPQRTWAPEQPLTSPPMADPPGLFPAAGS